MNRRVLLVEPNYKNKYPPMGLMKLATYHKMLGDKVTFFTFYWAQTIDTINFFKPFCKNINEVLVGGIAASVVPDEIEKETGIKPFVSLLDKGGEYDDNEIIIDHVSLDYSILEEIDYVYPEHDGYYGYMTRGCVNKCPFCAVPRLELKYCSYIPITKQIEAVSEAFGDKRNLLLLDNNVLASSDFEKIIDEIKACGFDGKQNMLNRISI